MKLSYWKAIIYYFVIFSFLTVPFSAEATSITFQEVSLTNEPESSAAGIYQAGDGDLLLVDDLQELWKIDPLTGEYENYFPLGGPYNLADIALAQDNMIWWSDNNNNFGSLNLDTSQIDYFNIIETDFSVDKLNLGPIAYTNGNVWLASLTGTNFGLFNYQPNATIKNLCLYPFPGGLVSADMVARNSLLWMLDYHTDSLLSFDPLTGELKNYEYTDRDMGPYSNLQVSADVLWWTEDALNGRIVRYDTVSNTITSFLLPDGSHPRNLSLKDGDIWFTDPSGTFSRMDPQQITVYDETIINLSHGSITPTCVLIEPYTYPLAPTKGTFEFINVQGTVEDSQTGLEVFSLPVDAEPFGITVTNTSVWVSDRGRQKLVRMVFSPDISVTKAASLNQIPSLGTNVTYTFEVKNIGNGTVTLTSLIDSVFGDLNGMGNCLSGGTIVAGDTYTCTVTKFLSFVGEPEHINEVTAIATGEYGLTDTATDKVTVTFEEVPPSDYSIYLPLLLK